MTYTEATSKGAKILRKNLWLLLVPILSDVLFLLASYIHTGSFIDISKIPQFQIKLAIPSGLPSLKNIVDAFPDLISFNTQTGWQGFYMLSSLPLPQLWNTVYLLCGILLLFIVSAFLEGGFLGCIAKSHAKDEEVHFADFLHWGAYYWGRFLTLKMLSGLIILSGIFFVPVFFLFLIAAVLLFYLSYALVWDDLSVVQAISKAYYRFTERLANSLGFIAYIAVMVGLASLVLIPLSHFNVFIGVVLYNSYASIFSAAVMVMYPAGNTEPQPKEEGENA